MKSPCKDCENRIINRHSHCTAYLKFKEHLEVVNEKIN